MPRAKRTLGESDANAAAPAAKSAKTTKKRAGKGKENMAESEKDSTSSNGKDSSTPKDPFEYITRCRPFFDFKNENRLKLNDANGDDEDDDGYLDADELREHFMEESKCGKDGCLCLKPLGENLDWVWTTTRKASEMHFDLRRGTDFRDPDNFGMYVFNDFAGYGMQELIENMLVAFNKEYNKKNSSLNELWAIIEALGYWLVADDVTPWNMLEDGERMEKTLGLIGCAALTMLNRLDLSGKLKPSSEFKNIPLVMSFFLVFAGNFEDVIGEEDGVFWNQHIVSYARRNGIELSGMAGIEKVVAELEEDIDEDVPFIKGKPGVDHWKWKENFKDFEKEYADNFIIQLSRKKRKELGGDAYDITKWSSKERKEYSFDHKDPIPKDIRDALARGENVMLG